MFSRFIIGRFVWMMGIVMKTGDRRMFVYVHHIICVVIIITIIYIQREREGERQTDRVSERERVRG